MIATDGRWKELTAGEWPGLKNTHPVEVVIGPWSWHAKRMLRREAKRPFVNYAGSEAIALLLGIVLWLSPARGSPQRLV